MSNVIHQLQASSSLIHLFAQSTSVTDTRIAHVLLNNLTTDLKEFVNQAAQGMMSILKPAGTVAFTISVLWWAVKIASGQSSEPFTDGMTRMLRIAVIGLFAFNAGTYNSDVANFFFDVPSQIAASMLQTVPDSALTATDENSIATVIDNVITQGNLVEAKIQQYSSTQLSATQIGAQFLCAFYAILVAMVTVLFAAVATAMIFTSYVAMAVLLAVGPIFILLAIFPQTQQYFERWVGQLVTFALLFVLVACVIALCMSFMTKFTDALPLLTTNQVILNALKLIGITIACFAVLLQTRVIAAALGGGLALAGQNVAGRLASIGSTAAGVSHAAARSANHTVRDVAGAAALTAVAGVAAGVATVSLARKVWNGSRGNSVSGSTSNSISRG